MTFQSTQIPRFLPGSVDDSGGCQAHAYRLPRRSYVAPVGANVDLATSNTYRSGGTHLILLAGGGSKDCHEVDLLVRHSDGFVLVL